METTHCSRCGETTDAQHCPDCAAQLAELIRSVLIWGGEERPPAVDMSAQSAMRDMPSFAAPPAGSEPYHGFPVLERATASGFRLGMITNFLTFPESRGDAFVIAPDGSRAGLIWEETDRTYFEQAGPISEERWGVWSAGFIHPMRSEEDARRNLETIVPNLRESWQRWVRGEIDEFLPASEIISRHRERMNDPNPEVAARAALDLGDALEDEGDREGAVAAFGRAMASSFPWAAAWGAYRIAGLFIKQGRLDDAVEPLRYAIAVGIPIVTGPAANDLGWVLEQLEDRDGAMEAYRTGMSGDDAEAAASSANALAQLLEREGDLEAAERLYRELVDSGPDEQAGWAAYRLGELLLQRGEVDGARRVWQDAIESPQDRK